MLRATFFHKDSLLCGFDLDGHCGGEAGQDIVCAAVSSAAYMTVNTLTDVCLVETDTKEQDGRLVIRLAPNSVNRGQDILQGFYLHMTELHKQYPKKIALIDTEV